MQGRAGEEPALKIIPSKHPQIEQIVAV
jgi:hypothetical protein